MIHKDVIFEGAKHIATVKDISVRSDSKILQVTLRKDGFTFPSICFFLVVSPFGDVLEYQAMELISKKFVSMKTDEMSAELRALVKKCLEVSPYPKLVDSFVGMTSKVLLYKESGDSYMIEIEEDGKQFVHSNGYIGQRDKAYSVFFCLRSRAIGHQKLLGAC